MNIFNSYTGEAQTVETQGIVSLGVLGALIAETQHVEPANQLLLLQPSANQLRLETAVDGQRVFLFDLGLIRNRSLTRSKYVASAAVSTRDLQSPPEPPPADAAEDTSVPNVSFFQALAAWATDSLRVCKEAAQAIYELQRQSAVIDQGIQLALTHMDIHLRKLAQNFKQRHSVAETLAADVKDCGRWPAVWDAMRTVPCLGAKLPELADKLKVEESYSAATQTLAEANKLLATIKEANTKIQNEGAALLTSAFNYTPADSNEPQVAEREIETLLKKVISDAKSLEQVPDEKYEVMAPRVVRIHKQDILPELELAFKELLQLEKAYAVAKAKLQDGLCDCLGGISRTQLHSVQLKKEIKGLTQILEKVDKHKVKAAHIIDLPFVYGLALIEEYRRRSWDTKVRGMASEATIKFETLRKQEYERIDQWLHQYSKLESFDKLTSIDVDLCRVKVTVTPETQPPAPALEIHDYLKELRGAGLNRVCDDLKRALHEMETETDLSVEEKALTTSSSSSGKYETRIRKLEELLLKCRFDFQQQSRVNDSKETAGNALALKRPPEKVEQVAQTSEYQVKALEKELEDLKLTLKQQEEEQKRKDEVIAALTQDKTALNQRVVSLSDKCTDLSQRIYSTSHNLDKILRNMGLLASKQNIDGVLRYKVSRVKGLSRRTSMREKDRSTILGTESGSDEPEGLGDSPLPDPELLHWVNRENEDESFQRFAQDVYIDFDTYRDSVCRRFGDVEKVARKYHSEVKTLRDNVRHLEQGMRSRLALNQFAVGDLILFLPTRDPDRLPNPWAAFNVNAPYYFLDPSIADQLHNREYLIARATAVVQYQVPHGASEADNPFGLPEGMKWNIILTQ